MYAHNRRWGQQEIEKSEIPIDNTQQFHLLPVRKLSYASLCYHSWKENKEKLKNPRKIKRIPLLQEGKAKILKLNGSTVKERQSNAFHFPPGIDND